MWSNEDIKSFSHGQLQLKERLLWLVILIKAEAPDLYRFSDVCIWAGLEILEGCVRSESSSSIS